MKPRRSSAQLKRLTLAACILGSGIVFLDSTVVNVALPALQRDLGAGLASQQWVVEAYLLTLGSLLLVGGSLHDLLDRRSVFAAGLAGFGLSSLLCALAPSVELLVAARALQGVAGALLVPSSLAILISTYGEDERGRAIGTWTAWTGIATVLGPVAGGALIDGSSWRLIFMLNVPLVAITLVLTARAVPSLGTRRIGAGVDWLGAALCACGLGGAIFALIEGPRLGFATPAVIGAGAGGGAALACFVLYERRARAPMLPLWLFGIRNFAVGNLATLTLYAGLGGALFLLQLYLQQVAGYAALAAGAAFLPVTALMFTLSPRTGALASRVGPRWFMAAGPAVASAGLLLLLLRVGTPARYASDVLPGVATFGLGLALTVAPLTATVLGAVDKRHSGIASGVNNATARVAGLLAIAALGAAVAGRFTAAVDAQIAHPGVPAPVRAALAQAKARPLSIRSSAQLRPGQRARVTAALDDASQAALRLGLGLAAGLVLLGGAVSAVGIENPRRRPAAERARPPDTGPALEPSRSA
jgi:EmrB/QacA subfamily drug resistance transporter